MESSYWLYFQEEEAYKDEFSVYGEAFLKDGAEDYSDAYAKILKGRVRSGQGKWAPVKLDSGKIKLVKVLDVTKYAKKYNLFGQHKKIDEFLIPLVTTHEERESGGESVTIPAKELYERVRDYIKEDLDFNPTDEFDYTELPSEPVLPRCDKHANDIAVFMAKHNQFLLDNGFDVAKVSEWIDAEFEQCRKLSKHFIQLWCCGAGKSTTPVLVYEACIEELWNFRKSYPINLVTSPTLKVLTGNLITLASNSIAKKKQELHVCYTGGVEKDKTTLAYLKSLGIEVISDRTQFVKYMKKWTKTHTVWIHTTYQSYYYRYKKLESKSSLTYQMRKLGRSFYFAYLDEIHKTYQPNRNPFSAVHYDDLCRIENRFKCTASKRDWKGPGSVKYKKEFHVGKYNDVEFNRLTIQQAYKRGYTRNYKILDFLVKQELLDTLIGKKDIVEVFYNKKMPWVTAAGTDISVPFSYWANAITQMYIRFAGVAPISHTLGVVNEVNNGVLYKEFFDAVRPQFALQLCNGNKKHPMYERLMNIHCDVMDTKAESDSVKIFSRIDQVPLNYNDSILIHCYVAEVGWNPGSSLTKAQQKKYKGFIDSVTFIDNVSSADRIQQNSGRGARLAELTKGFKQTCYIILNHLIDYEDVKNPYNKRYNYTKLACRALEVGNEEIKQKVTFYDATNLGSGGTGGNEKGDKHNTAMFITGDMSGVDQQWQQFQENGDRYTPLFESTKKVIDKFEEYCELNNWQSVYVSSQVFYAEFSRFALTEFKGYWGDAKNTNIIINDIIRNRHWTISADQDIRLDGILDRLDTTNEIILETFKQKLVEKVCVEVRHCIKNKTEFKGSSASLVAPWLKGFFEVTAYNFDGKNKDIYLPLVTYKLPDGKKHKTKNWESNKISKYTCRKSQLLIDFVNLPEIIKVTQELQDYLDERKADIIKVGNDYLYRSLHWDQGGSKALTKYVKTTYNITSSSSIQGLKLNQTPSLEAKANAQKKVFNELSNLYIDTYNANPDKFSGQQDLKKEVQSIVDKDYINTDIACVVGYRNTTGIPEFPELRKILHELSCKKASESAKAFGKIYTEKAKQERLAGRLTKRDKEIISYYSEMESLLANSTPLSNVISSLNKHNTGKGNKPKQKLIRFLGKVQGNPKSGSLIPMTAQEGCVIKLNDIMSNIHKHRPNLKEEVKNILGEKL
jgi:hypothetical protein